MLAVAVFLLILSLTSYASDISIYSESVYPGSLNYIKINSFERNSEYTIEIESGSKTYRFPVKDSIAFFAVPYKSSSVITVNLLKDGRVIYRKFISVSRKSYPVSKIRVKERKRTKEVLKRIEKEYFLLRKIFRKYSQKLFDESSFYPPLDKLYVTTPFGAKRIINGKKRSIHWGTDFRAAEGTPVYASLSGKVEIARDLFFTGNTVIINHGLGLFTLYAHLSEISVKEGSFVKAGQIIGKVGSTGRSTAPHLHFGIYINDQRVDPELALDIIFLE
ncbi:MAG TPA: M23 family peptidase [Persephonella sp.]|uniref:Peptidase, M23/M37 family n=1 Tax=Persephonella marina (strain DSM 14350 / EX-H1) TaxID=123214 RepID=C0QPF1_PERMH|nr:MULTISPECIES: M23 family metallopeptidase [Persephonella]ACO03251.1 peptidase, M23/M37 family [Persephonella marina EX-H1]HCB69838.1 M23 family peptidase [Persephonella sp.]